MTISKYMNENEDLELTTLQQLYIEIPEFNKEEITVEKKIEVYSQEGRRERPFINY